jgi:4-hydroxybenzoate polyprenyltransferase
MLSLFRFFVYSNLFIAVCALLMVNQTYQLFLPGPPDKYFLGFVFSATICSYSFHWYLTSQSMVESPRIEWVKKHRHYHLALFIVGLIGCAFFFYFLLPNWYWLGLSAVITFLYSAPKVPHPWFRSLRKVAIGKTIFLSLVWMYVTTALPLLIEKAVWSAPVILFVVNRFFFIYAICIMFDFRDREDDKAAGIRSMITWFSEKNVDRLFFISLGIYAITSVFLLRYDFSVPVVIMLLIPGVIAGSIYQYAKRNFGDYLYYFILDGLMMLSALLMLIARI